MTDSLKEVVTSLKPDKSSLLPCPFCGGEAEIVTLNMLVEHSPVGVGCSSCAAILGEYSDYKRFNTEAEAIEAWNTRASETQLLAEMQTRVWIAERQRNEAMAALMDEGIKLPRERTCRNVHEYRDEDGVLHRDARIFKCSACGFKADDFYGDDEQSFPRYYPNCGAKVVSE